MIVDNLEFYDNNMSVCAQKVRLVLQEKNLAYTRHHLDLRAGDQFHPDYVKLNPKAVVPTIVHNGHAIIESTVIIAYLEDAFPEPTLTPSSALQRARVLQWMILPDAGLHDACGLTSFALAFRKQLANLPPEAFEAHLAKMPDEKRRAHIQSLVKKGLEAPGVPEALRSYHKAIRLMDEVLCSGDFLAGETYSLADITMLPYVLRLEHLGLNWFWATYPRVSAWFDRIKNRDSYQAISDYLDPKYLEVLSSESESQRDRVKGLLSRK